MTTNLDNLVLAVRSLRVSEDFVQGTLFMLGGVLMRADAGTPEQEIHEAMQWVFPHDINAVSENILDRMHDSHITKTIEEFFYQIGIEIPMREIRVENFVTHLCTPADRGLLPKSDPAVAEMRRISHLYYAAVEEIGRGLKKSQYGHAEAYLAGLCFFGVWARIDMNATGFIVRALDNLAPPALKFFFALPRVREADPVDWLPTQIALWGLVTGLDETFMQVAWPYQSWMLFKEGNPISGVENLTPTEFYFHCYEISKKFAAQNQVQIRRVASLGVGPDDVPAFSGINNERADLFRVIINAWGYDPEDETLPEIERKQVNACIIFTLFCSLCRAAIQN